MPIALQLTWSMALAFTFQDSSFLLTKLKTPPPTELLCHLQETMHSALPIRLKFHGKHSTYKPHDLAKWDLSMSTMMLAAGHCSTPTKTTQNP